MKPDQPASSDLCLACGLCCDGSLFEHATLHPNEEEAARNLGLDVLGVSNTAPSFKQPCLAFNSQCTIYDQRPQVCQKFRCKQLLRYSYNQASLQDGLAKISRARAMQAELATLLPNPSEHKPSLAEVKRQLKNLSTPEARRSHLAFVLLAVQYEMFLRTHFLTSHRKKDADKDSPIMSR